MQDGRLIAVAIAAAGALVAIGTYAGLCRVAAENRYAASDAVPRARFDKRTGAIAICGPTLIGGVSSIDGVPRTALNHLRRYPDLRDEFDLKYGAGTSAQALEGTARGIACD